MNNGCILVEIPARFKGVAEAVGRLGQVLSQAEQLIRTNSGDIDYGSIERAIAGGMAEVERSAHGDLLPQLDIDARCVEIKGKLYTRLGRTRGRYRTLTGEVAFERTLYRELGVRNGPTVDPISVRIGAVGDGWLPQAARTIAHLMQQGTCRDAEATAGEMGRLPYSRSSFDRVAHEVGKLLLEHDVAIEDTLCQQFEVPEKATSVSASIDRVSVPMEEPRKRPPGRPPKNAPKRPVERNFRMAWCGTVTFHDENGDALHTIRYGRMPQGDFQGMGLAMANAVYWALQQRSDLELSLLADGAHEMWALLEEVFAKEIMGKPAHRLVDFWHLLEKLAPAAAVIYGEDADAVLKRWRRNLKRRSSAAAAILSELDASGCEEPAFRTDRPVHNAMTYLTNHAHRMNYARARKEGRPIGSGNVEATCKSLVAMRMKRPGSRWKEQTGEHIIRLRAMALSDRWDGAMVLLMATQRAAVRPAA